MNDRHDPSSEFIERLGGELAGVLRRNRSLGSPAAPRRARAPVWLFALVASCLLGASGVLFAQHVAHERERELITLKAEIRAERAKRREESARKNLKGVRARYESGVASSFELRDAEAVAASASTQRAQRDLDLEEVGRTGSDPRREVNAPRVGDRDFVTEALRLEQTHLAERKAAADRQVVELKAMYDASAMDENSLRAGELARDLVAERHALVPRLLELRRGFLAGDPKGPKAQLLELRERALTDRNLARLRRDEARGRFGRVERLYRAGVVSSADLRSAEGNNDRYETELQLAEVELQRIDARLKAS